ncbi:MAG: MATE family efflux transporter [Oscillospiraceae bacterium]|nr:MATE family efflux transporter [Oscillospiraceae bacterium]
MLPVLGALFLQTMYGAVDLLVVGQFGGEHADVYVSAVSTGAHLMHTVTFIITGIAMGLTISIGRCVGAGKREEAGDIIGSSVVLFSVLTVVMIVLMMFFTRPIAKVMNAPPEAFEDTVRYMLICSAGLMFIVAYNLVGSIFRGAGDSKLPLITVAISCTVNVAADLLLVAVFHMGAVGAAIATVFAQALSVVLSLLIARKRSLPFVITKESFRPNKKYIGMVLRLGIPISLQDLLVNTSFLVLIAIVNRYGVTASAGVGVADRLCGLIMLITMAFMQAMSAFVAQNMGACKPERAKKALLYGILTSLGVGIVVGLFTFFRGDLLSRIFARDEGIILASWEYLKAYAIDCFFTSILFCMTGYFNGLGKTAFVMTQAIVGAFFVRLPVAWIMSREIPGSLFHLGLSTPASSLVQLLLCVVFFIILKKRGVTDGADTPNGPALEA